jgi:hypothetical protein
MNSSACLSSLAPATAARHRDFVDCQPRLVSRRHCQSPKQDRNCGLEAGLPRSVGVPIVPKSGDGDGGTRHDSHGMCGEPEMVRASAGAPVRSSTSTSRSGAAARTRSAAAARARSRSFRSASDTVSRPDTASTWRSVIRGSRAAADTIRSGRPRSTASRAAQSTARSDSSEPSVPATIGLHPLVTVAGPCRSGRGRQHHESVPMHDQLSSGRH